MDLSGSTLAATLGSALAATSASTLASTSGPTQMIRVKRKRVQDPPDIILVEGNCDHNYDDGNGGDGDGSRAAKRQTIGRAEGAGADTVRKGLGGMGGKSTRRGGRSFVLRRVTLERGIVSSLRTDAATEPKGTGSNNSGDTRPNGSAVSSASVLQSGGVSGKGRSTKGNLRHVNGIHARSQRADRGPGYDRHRKPNRDKRRQREKSARDRSWASGSRKVVGSESQDLRDEMLEYATSQMAAVDFGSGEDRRKIRSDDDDGIKDGRSKHTLPPRHTQHLNNYKSTIMSTSHPNSKPTPKPVTKPKQKPKPRSKVSPSFNNKDDVAVSKNPKITSGKSKADLKAAAIMQAFAIDTTSHDTGTDNSSLQPSSQHEKNIQERKLKRPGASAAEKAWRLQNWKSQRLQRLQQEELRDVPVLTLAAGPVPGHKHRNRSRPGSISKSNGTNATYTEEDMDIDSANNETGTKNSIHRKNNKCNNGNNDDNNDDNSDTYDTYIREPKSHLRNTDYKSAKVGYLTISDHYPNHDEHNKHHHHYYHHNNNDYNNNCSSTRVNDTTLTTSTSTNQPNYNNSASSNYWSSIWDTWDAELELELEAEIEKRLQTKLEQYRNRHNSQKHQHHHNHHYQQQHHQHQEHELQTHKVQQQLRQHIRAQIQREHRHAARIYTNNYSSSSSSAINDHRNSEYSSSARYTYRDTKDDDNGSDGSDDDDDDDEYDEDEDADEEDENAENHWAADYPDEESWDHHQYHQYHHHGEDWFFGVDDVDVDVDSNDDGNDDGDGDGDGDEDYGDDDDPDGADDGVDEEEYKRRRMQARGEFPSPSPFDDLMAG